MLRIETDNHLSYRSAITFTAAFSIHFVILGFMYWPLRIRGAKLFLHSCTNTFLWLSTSVVLYMCQHGKVPGSGGIKHESMVLLLKGGIVRMLDLGCTGVIIGLQTCFLLWVMRMAWSPKIKTIESIEAEKVSIGGKY